MKKTRKILSFMLFVLMLVSVVGLGVSAITKNSFPPNPSIEYSYSTDVNFGTIRYISQNSSSPYFNSNYWGSWAGQAGSECGTSSISMALSYIGINKTPQSILDAHGGTTYFTGWGVTTETPSIVAGVANFVDGKGKYSPLIVHFTKGYDPVYGHWVLLIGKVSETSYLVLDPASDVTWELTTSDYRYISIDRMYQYYNPDAILNTDPTTSERVEFNGHYYQVFDEGIDWYAAKARCEEMGGHLVTITSKEEQTFIDRILTNNNKSNYWAGATDEESEGKWKWITGEEFSYTNWNINEPNNTEYFKGEFENYLHISTSVNNMWNDAYFDAGERVYGGVGVEHFGFICEWETNPEKPTEPSTPDEPTTDPSTPDKPDEPKNEGNIFTKIIDFFKNIINKILSIFKW